MKKTISILMIAALLLVILPLFVSQGSEAADKPIVTIYLNEAEQVADVSGDRPATVVFTGYVDARIPTNTGVEMVTVDLISEAQGWLASIEPSTIEFSENGTQNFTASVDVPRRTSAQLIGELTVTGRARVIPGSTIFYNVEPVKANIKIANFYVHEITIENDALTIKQGGTGSTQFKIRNVGNDQDTVMVNVEEENEKEIVDRGWGLSFSQTQYIIDEGCDQVVRITIKPGSNSPAGTYEIILKVFSYQAISQEMDPVEQYVFIKVNIEKNSSAHGFEIGGMLISVILLVICLSWFRRS